MTDLINNYPKSSCNCYKCTLNNYNFPKKGKPTNISVRDCEIPDYYDCYYTKQFKDQIEPRNMTGFIDLNPTCVQKNYDKSFEKVEYNNQFLNGEKKVVYASTDPRLVSASHNGQILALDRPAIDGSIKLADIYTDPSLKYYGKKNCMGRNVLLQ
jgi:hypothetical protein